MLNEVYPDLEENATVTYLSRADRVQADDLLELFPVYKETSWRKGALFAGAALLVGVSVKLLIDANKEQ
jgi:hypothetical protein